MNEPTATSIAANELLKAFAELQQLTLPITAHFEYRIYYHESTKVCTFKTTDDLVSGSKWIIVTKEVYDNIEYCPDYYVADGKLLKKESLLVSSYPKKLLQLDKNGKYQTIKDDIIFRVDDGYLKDTDCWGIRGFDDY